MINENNAYCMEFSNADIKAILIDPIRRLNDDSFSIKIYSKEYKEISIEGSEDVKSIEFADKIIIDFLNKQTSIFACDEEIMFIDEKAKRYSYTLSDIYGNVVYENSLRYLSREEMLKMFCDIILCLIDAESIDILEEKLDENKYINYYNYIDELKKYIIVVNKQFNSSREKVFSNIHIRY